MTELEMTELFGVMILAWPNAELFRGGIKKLEPTIRLWSARTEDIDSWLGGQAIVRLIDTCKFPPTIAEFRDQAKTVADEIRQNINHVFRQAKFYEHTGKGLNEWYRLLPEGSAEKITVGAMGGPAKMVTDDGLCWNYELYARTYNRLIRNSNPITGDRGMFLPPGKD